MVSKILEDVFKTLQLSPFVIAVFRLSHLACRFFLPFNLQVVRIEAKARQKSLLDW